MGGYKQISIQNYANGTFSRARKGMLKQTVNHNRSGKREEINKKRLHDGILRYGILKMVYDIGASFQVLNCLKSYNRLDFDASGCRRPRSGQRQDTSAKSYP